MQTFRLGIKCKKTQIQTFPGFMMFFGSMAFLMDFCNAKFASLKLKKKCTWFYFECKFSDFD